MQLLPLKTLRAFFVFVLVIAICLPQAHGEEQIPATLVIVDTGIDPSLPIFQGHLIYEVCILDWTLCPNGTNFQEGLGSASLHSSIANVNGFDHGTQMASIAVRQVPDLRFIFIRIVANSSYGNRMNVSNENVSKVLDWIAANRVKFNIRAVAMSQGHHQLLSGKKYCPVVPTVDKSVKRLKLDGVAIFFPAGNQGDKKRIDWPACIPDSIAIGGINANDQITKFSNMDFSLTDLYALADTTAINPGGRSVNASGTSVSVQVAATQWMQFVTRYPQATYSQTFRALRTSGKIVFDSYFRFGRKIDIDAAFAKYETGTALTSIVSE